MLHGKRNRTHEGRKPGSSRLSKSCSWSLRGRAAPTYRVVVMPQDALAADYQEDYQAVEYRP
jgi:hypothetical protein